MPVAGAENPGFACGQILHGVDAEGGGISQVADHPALVGCPGSVGRVLNDGQAVLAGDGVDLVHIGRKPRQVDRQDGFGSGGDVPLDLGGVHVAGVGLNIHEHGHRPLMENGERPREEGIGRHQDLIAGTDGGSPQRHVQSIGAGADGTTVGGAHTPGPLPLQCGNLGRVASSELLLSQNPA